MTDKKKQDYFSIEVILLLLTYIFETTVSAFFDALTLLFGFRMNWKSDCRLCFSFPLSSGKTVYLSAPYKG